jgi:capsular exopolysaccharide synthesis family protein
MLERNDMILRDDRHAAIAAYQQPRVPFAAPPVEEAEPSLIGSIFRHIWIVVLTLALSFGAACVYLNRTQPLYTRTSTIYIEQTRAPSINPELASAERGGYLYTQCEMIKSTPILRRVLEMPEVQALPVFSKIPDQLLYLRTHVESDVGKRDDIISTVVESPDPQESAVLVNTLIETYIQYRAEQTEKLGSTQLQALTKRYNDLMKELEKTRSDIKIVLASDPTLKLTDGKGDNPSLQRMMAASQQLSQVNMQIMQMEMTYGAAYKPLQQLKTVAAKFDEEYRAAKAEALKTSDKQQQIEALRQNEKDLQARIDPLFAQMNQLELSENLRRQIAPVQRLEDGRVERKPSSPKKTNTLALAAVIGLVLGCATALLRDRMDNRLRTIEEVQGYVGLTILGVVPRMPGRRTAVARAMAVHLDPRSEVAEAYRTIRTAVYFTGQGAGNRAKTLLVTSPEPGDGKTTSASNLAIAIAQTGRNILLLDADFRKPTQHKNLDVKDSVGLSSVLAGIETLDRAIQRTGVEGLDILPCGPIPENPSEILNSQEFGELIDRLALKYDHILFDSPPCNLVTDARILGAVCDASILVLRAEKSTRKAAEHARNALLSVGSNLLGVIVNDVPRGKGYEVYGGQYYGTPEMRTRGQADYGTGSESSSNGATGHVARLPRPTSDVSE